MVQRGTRSEIRRWIDGSKGVDTARACTDAEIRSATPLPISYLTAPVFDEPGHAQFEVQLGPLRQDVTKRERDDYVAALLGAAQQISGILQGG